LYNIGIQLYGLGISLASIFNAKAGLWVKGRKDWREALSTLAADRKTVWIHCASLGEFEQARPVIERIKAEYPNIFIVLTFFSPSGYEVRKNYDKADYVCYLPLDTPQNAKDFVRLVNPQLVLFVKYEFWLNYLEELNKKKVPTILFSAIFRQKQVFFKPWGGLFRNALKHFTFVGVQNGASKSILKEIGITAKVIPDTRFDRVKQIAEQAKSFAFLNHFKGTSNLFIAGSTWAKDEDFIKHLITTKALKNYKYVIAPHNLSKEGITSLTQSLVVYNIALFSQLSADSADADILIVDTMGHLSSIYAFGEIAYVGGAFGVSVHNVLEPAVYGIPVIFGPNHTKANEAIELQLAGAAFSFKTQAELDNIITRLADDKSRIAAGNKAKQYVYGNSGGTDEVMKEIKKYV
jgi:3-deoxy-D-manno-octulosonic-acid transferase